MHEVELLLDYDVDQLKAMRNAAHDEGDQYTVDVLTEVINQKVPEDEVEAYTGI